MKGPRLTLSIKDMSLPEIAVRAIERFGSPVSSSFPDLYATLGVTPGATTDEINEAYFAKIVKVIDSRALEHVIRVATAERDRRATQVC